MKYKFFKGIRFKPKPNYSDTLLIIHNERVLTLFILAPSKAPLNLSVIATSSTSVIASWQLPPADSRHGIITGYKLFYKIRGSIGAPTILSISSVYSGAKQRRTIKGLAKYTEYEFQVLAFTSTGDGPKSLFEVGRTLEDGNNLTKTVCFETFSFVWCIETLVFPSVIAPD